MLLQDVRQFLKGVLDAEKVLCRVKVAQMHMDDLCSEESDGAVNPTKFVKELKSWQTTLQHFVVKMEFEYPLYRDLLSQFLAGISQVEFCIDRKFYICRLLHDFNIFVSGKRNTTWFLVTVETNLFCFFYEYVIHLYLGR